MGKKSKRKGNSASERGKGCSVSSLTSEFTNLHVPSSTASCWICLDSEPDDVGRPLVRDCACRGDSGWSHLSCLIRYAESKNKEYLKNIGPRFWGTGMMPDGSIDHAMSDSAPWSICVNCKQGHRGQLMLDMSGARLNFAIRSFPLDKNMLVVPKTSFPCDPFKYVSALIDHLMQIAHAVDMIPERAPALIEEAERKGDLTIAVLSEMNTAVNHSCVHQSQGQIINFEASVYNTLGGAYMRYAALGFEQAGATKAVEYYEKSKAKYIQTGDQATIAFSVPNIDVELSQAHQLIGIRSTGAQVKKNIRHLRRMDKMHPSQQGKLKLATALLEDNQAIASQRLLDEIVATSRQVNGANHTVSQGLKESYQTCTLRRVHLEGGSAPYLLVSYKNEETAEVRGPVTRDNWNTGKTFTVNVSKIKLLPPMPVVCQGLKGATHINGEIGDVRAFDAERQRYEVHFENPMLKKVLIKYENLRVLFELPPRKEEQQNAGPTAERHNVAQRKVANKCSV